MPLLGRQGIIEFRRELPSPAVLPASALDKPNKQFLVNNDNFWPCDPVIVVGSVNGLQSTLNGFYSKDTLDRASIHTTIQGAANNDPATRISLNAFQQKSLVVLLNNHSCQTLAALKFYNSEILASNYLGTEETTLADWPTNEDAYYAAGPRFAEWKIVAWMRGWNLSTSAPAVDVSSLGEKFSEAVKSVVSGSGSLDFIIDLFGSSTEHSPEALLRIAMMTERGATGNARFYLNKDDPNDTDSYTERMNNRSLVRTSVYYNANILFTNAAVDVSSDSLVQGSADFVTTGPIRLGAETIKPEVFSCEQTTSAYDFFTYSNPVNLSYTAKASQQAYYDDERNLYSYVCNRPTGSFGTDGHILAKFTGSGIPAWTMRYRSNDESDLFYLADKGQPMTVDKDGFPWIAFTRVTVSGTQRGKVYIAKINPSNGSILSSFCFAIDLPITNVQFSSQSQIQAMCVDDSNNIYLGFAGLRSGYDLSHFILKVSSSGSFVWSKTYQVTRFSSSHDAISSLRVRNGILYVLYQVGAMQRISLDGTLLGPMTGWSLQPSMASSSPNDCYPLGFDFDSAGNIYMACNQGTNLVAKVDANLQPVWAYYVREYAIGDTIYTPGTIVDSTGYDVVIDNQDRVFLTGYRSAASSMGGSAAASFIEMTIDGVLVNGRSIIATYGTPYGDGAYQFAQQRKGSVDPDFIPIRQAKDAPCYGYLAKTGQIGTWAASPSPFTFAQPAYDRSYQMPFTVSLQQSNAWTPYDPNHTLLSETVASFPVTNYTVNAKSQTGVIAT
jgi:hypothetical protein